MPDDSLSARIAIVRHQVSLILAASSPDLMSESERAYSALEVLAMAHEPVQVYWSADGCEHPQPDMTDTDAAAEWLEDHQAGHDAGGEDTGTICLLSPRELACPECSRLVHGTFGDENRWVSADECIVRPPIARAMDGESRPEKISEQEN